MLPTNNRKTGRSFPPIFSGRINVVSDPGKYTYYENMSSSGKIPYTIPIMDEIEVYFTDKYGDIIDDIT
jgi:hypothetical protein